MTKQPTCHYDAERGWLSPEHRTDCDQRDCTGCRPCGKSHCAMLGRCANHVEQGAGIYTCPACIGKVRSNVRKILTHYAELPAEFEFSGVESEPLNLHGPSADPAQWAARREILRNAYAERGWCDFPRHGATADDDPDHPLAVLAKWDIAVRESYGHTSDLFVTVSRAVDYLAGDVLDTFAHTQEFEEFAKDVRHCLAHLEDVLALSKRAEQGAPCPVCRVELSGTDQRAPRLEKHIAEHHPRLAPGHVCQPGRELDDQGRSCCKTCRGDLDSWHCPRNPEHHWDHVSYRARVDGDYLEHATALTASQMHEAHGIKPGTLRQWANRDLVKRRGRNAQGQLLYDVAQARAASGDTQDALA